MSNCKILLLLATFGGAGALDGQLTQIDLRLQSRNVDFSAASSTKPFQSGTGLPSTCGQGAMYYRLDAPAGMNVYGCTATNSWTLEQGPAASMASHLGDFAVTLTSPTTLAIGANCSTTTPCLARFGALVYSFASAATTTISAGSGLALVYVSSAGVLTVASNVTASCNSGCTALSSATAFPADAIPVFTWSATNGTWDASGGADQRAFLSSKSVTAGTGITTTEISGKTQLSADTTVIGLRVAAPATSSTVCTAGSSICAPRRTCGAARLYPPFEPCETSSGF
ncbi:MAG: hypothetical protein ABSH31_01270 [Bryobacteraceae bacterium]|jgi:hypothetical protein